MAAVVHAILRLERPYRHSCTVGPGGARLTQVSLVGGGLALQAKRVREFLAAAGNPEATAGCTSAQKLCPVKGYFDEVLSPHLQRL